jgi:hypothetical protein
MLNQTKVLVHCAVESKSGVALFSDACWTKDFVGTVRRFHQFQGDSGGIRNDLMRYEVIRTEQELTAHVDEVLRFLKYNFLATLSSGGRFDAIV